jgi:hypothetical protein
LPETEKEENYAGIFLTHARYLRALAWIGGYDGENFNAGLESISQSVADSGHLPEKTKNQVNLAQIKTSLRNAWGTELLLNLGAHFLTEDESVRISNCWGAVQAYYIAYHSVHALVVARNQPRPQAHTKTQNLFVDYWIKNRLKIYPWSLGFSDSGGVNVPEDIGSPVDTKIHQWSNLNFMNRWSIALKAMETTRREEHKNALRRARENKKRERNKQWSVDNEARSRLGKRTKKKPKATLPVLSKEERLRVNSDLRTFGLIDYLYRVRIRANYKDSAAFTCGPDNAEISTSVRNDMIYLATGTLLLHEMYICAMVGSDTFYGWVSEWNKSHMPAITGFACGPNERIFLTMA